MNIRVDGPLYGGTFAAEAPENSPPLAFVLPGELVTIAQTETPGRSVPERAEVLESSSERRVPRCAHFGVCGGCQYQHANYTAQMTLKGEILHSLLSRAGLNEVGSPLPQIIPHHAEEWGYRNRIRLRVEPNLTPPDRSQSPISLGYRERGTNAFLPIRMCPIAAPLLWRAAETLQGLARSSASALHWLSSLAEVEMFCNGDQTALQLTFFVRQILTDGQSTSQQSFNLFCAAIKSHIPELTAAQASPAPELNRRKRRQGTELTWGAEGIAYAAAERIYWVRSGAFFQVNRYLIDRLVTLVCGDLHGSLAWDLFAGVGLFTRELAKNFDRVLAVEGGDSAAADLLQSSKAAASKPGAIGKFEGVRSATLDFLRAHQTQRERPDLVVLDPPRAGLGHESAEILARIAAPLLVYVSCDPITLARDLSVLTRTTYNIESIDFIDLFPQTFHIETIVKLRKR